MLLLTEFYSALAQIVRGYPAQPLGFDYLFDAPFGSDRVGCDRMQTFAVLSSRADLNADNLGKDARYWNKHYFYSQAWEDAGRPSDGFPHGIPALYVWVNIIDDTDLEDCVADFEFTLCFAHKFPGSEGDVCAQTFEERVALLYRWYSWTIKELQNMELHQVVLPAGAEDSLVSALLPERGSVMAPGGEMTGFMWGRPDWFRSQEEAGRIESSYEETSIKAQMPLQTIRGSIVKNGFTNATLALLMNLRLQISVQDNEAGYTYDRDIPPQMNAQ